MVVFVRYRLSVGNFELAEYYRYNIEGLLNVFELIIIELKS